MHSAFENSTLIARIRAGIPQGQAKRQHFTPQLILRGFLMPGADRLWQLDVKSGQPRPVLPASAASRRRFYTLTNNETDKRDEFIEGLLSLIEDAAANALKTLVASPATLSPDERVTLSYFWAAQLVRTPSALARMQAIARVVHVSELARLIVDDATFADVYAEVRPADRDVDPAWLQRWMREALLDQRIRITNERELSLTTMLELLDNLAGEFFPMPWSLLRADGASFVTSDSGLGVMDEWNRASQQVNVLGTTDARMLLPFARGQCVQIGPGGRSSAGVTERKVTSRDVMLANLSIYGWAQSYIFAESQQVASGVRREAKRTPRAVRGAQPFRQHVLIERDPDDDSLARAHRRVGRAPYIQHGGQAFDYVILRDDKDLAREALRALALSKARAVRRTGTTELRSGNQVLTPFEVRGIGRRS